MTLQESGEMYLETILMLSKEKDSVKSIDIAEKMGVSKPSVSRAIHILEADKYVEIDKTGNIKLSKTGLAIAKKIYEKHLVLTTALISLGIDKKTAEADACKIEHDLSEKTFNTIKKYLKDKKIDIIEEVPKAPVKPVAKPEAKKATTKAATKTATKAKPAAKPAAKAKATTKPATKATSKPAAKSTAKPAAKKATTKPATKTTTKATAKPATKTATKATAKPATKTATKATAKPAVKKATTKPAAKKATTKTSAKSAAKKTTKKK